MERNNFNSIFEKHEPGKRAGKQSLTKSCSRVGRLLHSSRLKLLLFCALLLGHGVLVSALFVRNTRSFTQNMERITALRSEYYNGYSSIARVHANLLNYTSYANSDYWQAYQESRSDLSDFIDLLTTSRIGPDSYNLGLLCRQYLDSTAATVERRKKFASSDTEELSLYLDEAEHRFFLVVSYASYSMNELETYINEKTVTLNQQTTDQLNQVIFIFIIITTVFSLLAFLFIRYFLHPLEKLTALVRDTSTETWEITQPPVTRKDEMGLLYHAFYEMMNKNRSQYNELKARQQLEIELQREREKAMQAEAAVAKTRLKVFQSQINSHFLFNTMNMISRMAYLEHAPRVQNASNLLAQFLRSVLGQVNRIVTLEEEFDTVESYIKIQKLRFQDRIVFESTLDPDLSLIKIPSVTLQPLVENAVVHGVSMSPSGFVQCSALLEGNDVVLAVYDDGRGMSASEAEALLNRLEADVNMEEDNSSRIGLMNVYRRLLLCYPQRVTPIVESQDGEYCRIGFRISDIL